MTSFSLRSPTDGLAGQSIRRTSRLARTLVLIALAALTTNQSAGARDVQQIESSTGIKAWLVEEHGVPIVALGFAFLGGSAQDPEGRSGLAHVLSEMLDEGAGDLSAAAFKERVERLGTRLSVSASFRSINGGLVSLKKNFTESADLLRLALEQPRLTPDALEFEKKRILADLAIRAQNPQKVAVEAFHREAFAGHPLARSVMGLPADVGAVTASELVAHHRRLIARDNLHLVLVGALNPNEARAVLDRIFSGLPKSPDLRPVPPANPGVFTKKLSGAAGQKLSMAVFSLPAPALDSDDFFAALAVNHIVGSGNFDARLTREIRVKRGLTYSVSTQLIATPESSFLLGVMATKPENMDVALELLRGTLRDISNEGPTEKELANAKASLIGSYFLQQDTSSAHAAHLIGLAVDGLSFDYGYKRSQKLSALNLPEAGRVAREVFQVDGLSTLVVGPGAP